MKFQIPASRDQSTQVTNELPIDYPGPRISGAMTLQASTDAYHILVQELSHQLYSIRYNVLHFFKKISLECLSSKEGLHTQAALTNDVRQILNGIGKINIREGHYAARHLRQGY
jgi:hypothetical protein